MLQFVADLQEQFLQEQYSEEGIEFAFVGGEEGRVLARLEVRLEQRGGSPAAPGGGPRDEALPASPRNRLSKSGAHSGARYACKWCF